MRGRRSLWMAAGAVAVVLAAGCGADAGVRNASVADPTDSARYCQYDQNGTWVTNDRVLSTTPCVPDPAYASGNQVEDDSQVIPRCFTCKLSDWTRAETKKTLPSAPSDDDSIKNVANPSEWPPGLRDQVVDTCTSSWSGSPALCDCVVNQVAQQIPASEASGLSPNDIRLQAAVSVCDPAGGEP
jgi:hypothetical protein